jgi:hypothetical protein
MTQTAEAFPLLIPVTTGLLAIFGSWLGVGLSKFVEHDQWLRNEKYAVYKDVYRDLDSASRKIFDAYLDRVAPMGTQLVAPESLAFDLVSSQNVYDQRGRCVSALFKYHLAVYQARENESYDDPDSIMKTADEAASEIEQLRGAMRRDLKSKSSRIFRRNKSARKKATTSSKPS